MVRNNSKNTVNCSSEAPSSCSAEPTPSGDEASAVRHSPITDGVFSRRELLKWAARTTALVSASAFLGVNIGAVRYHQQHPRSTSEARDQLWEQLRKRGEVPDPMTVRLAVVALNAAGIEPVESQDEIRSKVAEQTHSITTTTRGQFKFEISYHEENESPDSTEERDGQSVPVYSREQMINIASRYDALGGASMVLLMVNSADSAMGDDVYAGLAIGGETTLTAIIRSHVARSSTIGHEIGHMLNPYVLGPGMEHEKVITTNFLRGADKQLRQAFAFDTIQQLIADGACELAKQRQDPTEVNEYASIYSIMGDSSLFSDDSLEGKPVFSSAEQLFLNPSLRSTLASGPGRYDISVEEGKNFAVRMKLPEDHVLQKLVPGAEELVFGALEDDWSDDDSAKIPHSVRSIGVFVTHSKGRGTVFLDIGHNFPINPPLPGVVGQRRHRWNEHAVYADDQLNIVAIAGTDEFQPYVRLLRLDTPQGQHFLHQAREHSRRLNEKSMENRR